MKMYVAIALIATVLVAVGLSSVVQNNTTTVVETPQLPTKTVTNEIATVIPIGKKKVKQLDLSEKQVLKLYGEVGEDSYYLSKQIIELAKSGEPIYLLINSPGGSVLDGALIVSAIEASPVPVYTICEELCASMAFIIHQYGTKRMMVNRAILMGHPASGGVQGTLEQMKTRVDMIQRYVNKFNAYIANRAGLSLDEYLPMVVSEMWIDAEDATKQKFNDEVVNVKLRIAPRGPISILEEQKRRNGLRERMNIRW